MIKPIITILLALLIVIHVKGPIFRMANVRTDWRDVDLLTNALTKPLMSLYATDQYLPDDIIKVMDGILPIDYWKERYSRFNSNSFHFNTPAPVYNLQHMDAIKIYMRLFKMYPAQVLSNRLDGINFFWNFIDPNIINLPSNASWSFPGFIKDNMDWIEPDWIFGDTGFYDINNPLRIFPEYIRNISYSIPLLRSIIWKDGIYICISLALLIFAISHKNKGIILSILTVYIMSIPYILIQHWQLVEYTWYFSICTIAILMFAITPKKAIINESINHHTSIQQSDESA